MIISDRVIRNRLITASDVVSATHSLLEHLPDFDAVIGIARSGMLPATIMSDVRHVPLYCAGNGTILPLGGGWRITSSREPAIGHVVIVDDDVYTGGSLASAKRLTAARFPGCFITTAAAHTWNRRDVDIASALLERPSAYISRFFNGGSVAANAFDLDGVLCGPHDRPIRLIRQMPCAAIITGRPQSEEPRTRAWLSTWRIRYNRLFVGPWRTHKERGSDVDIATWKASIINSLSPLHMFVESSLAQARVIASLSRNVLVACTQTYEILHKEGRA